MMDKNNRQKRSWLIDYKRKIMMDNNNRQKRSWLIDYKKTKSGLDNNNGEKKIIITIWIEELKL